MRDISLWFLRHFATGCDPPDHPVSLVTALGRCNGLSPLSANQSPSSAATDQWKSRIRSSLRAVWYPSILSDWHETGVTEVWAAAPRVKHNKLLDTNKTGARPRTNRKVLVFICFTFHINCTHLFVGPGWVITANDWVNGAKPSWQPDQLSQSPMMISR